MTNQLKYLLINPCCIIVTVQTKLNAASGVAVKMSSMVSGPQRGLRRCEA